jgi:Na+/phosphate symporter
VTTSASAFVASLLGARMLPLTAAVVAVLAAQLGAACAAVLLPGLATREALWVVVIGALGVLLAEDRRRPSSA